MRNVVPQEALERIGRLPHPVREELRVLIDAWYKSEQTRLTATESGKQLRQAQGAAQVLDDLSNVLKDPDRFRQHSPVPAQRSYLP